MRTKSTKQQTEELRAIVRYCACGCGGILPPPVCVTRIPKYLNGHNKRLLTPPYAVDPETGCWNWNRCTHYKGYGKITRPKGESDYAHRWMYEQVKGPIPDGLQLDHLCRNRRCVNPDHLEPVTQAENQRRGLQAKLTHEDIAELRQLKGTCSTREAGRRFKVSHQTVRKYWLQ